MGVGFKYIQGVFVSWEDWDDYISITIEGEHFSLHNSNGVWWTEELCGIWLRWDKAIEDIAIYAINCKEIHNWLKEGF